MCILFVDSSREVSHCFGQVTKPDVEHFVLLLLIGVVLICLAFYASPNASITFNNN